MKEAKKQFKDWNELMKKDFKLEPKIKSLWNLDNLDKRYEEE